MIVLSKPGVRCEVNTVSNGRYDLWKVMSLPPVKPSILTLSRVFGRQLHLLVCSLTIHFMLDYSLVHLQNFPFVPWFYACFWTFEFCNLGSFALTFLPTESQWLLLKVCLETICATLPLLVCMTCWLLKTGKRIWKTAKKYECLSAKYCYFEICWNFLKFYISIAAKITNI